MCRQLLLTLTCVVIILRGGVRSLRMMQPVPGRFGAVLLTQGGSLRDRPWASRFNAVGVGFGLVLVVGHRIASSVVWRVALMVSLAGVGRRFFCCGWFGRRVGPSNYKTGMGVGSGFEGADGANSEIGTPNPVVGTSVLGGDMFFRFVAHVAHGALDVHLIEMPVK